MVDLYGAPYLAIIWRDMGTTKQSHGIHRREAAAKSFRSVCFLTSKRKLSLLMFLALSLSIGHFVIQLAFSGNKPSVTNIQQLTLSTHNFKQHSWNDSYDFVHLNSESRAKDHDSSLLMIFPHSLINEETSSGDLKDNDRLALRKLYEFLAAMKELDGATCLGNRRDEYSGSKQDEINPVRNVSLESSWCRFTKRKWSLSIRNTGRVEKVQLLKPQTESSPAIEEIVFQNCNILQGPFVIRKDVFHRIGGLLKDHGKITLLEFFLRSKGELKMAKLSNCTWTPQITRVDRGTLEGSNNVPEYASFANTHQILRIVTESRIEWTACVANWKLCPEKPYVKPRSLPSVAAPICCSAVLGQMLEEITRALNQLGLEYRIIYGTLLGAVRSQAIIPWTHDVDITISKPAIMNHSTFAALEKELGGLYYVGMSFISTPRAHWLLPPYIDVDTAPFFHGTEDLQGIDALFSDEIEEAVRGMLPVSRDWRARGYIDLYGGHLAWMNGSSVVTINNRTYITVKKVHEELAAWYGKNYRRPSVEGKWSGLSDAGTA